MAGERERVLELVAQGTITIEQGEQLLDALERPPQTPVAPIPPVPPTAPAPPLVRIRKREVRTGRNRTFDQLLQFAIHDIKPSYIKAMRDAGLEDLTADELVQLGIHEISPEYVRAMRDAVGDLDVSEIVQLGIHDVSPETVLEWRAAGVTDLMQGVPSGAAEDDE